MPKWLSHRAKTALAPKGLKRNLGSFWPFLIYSAAVNFQQQRNKNICECWTQNTVLIIHEENSKERNV
jgi:hypothetical protein